MEEIFNKNELHSKLMSIIKNHPTSIRDYSERIGISDVTLRLFLKRGNSGFKTMLLIEKFIESYK